MAIFTILSLFSGAGGLDLALHIAVPGSRTICYVERELAAAAILAARMEDGSLDAAPIWSDVTTFDGTAWRGTVDCVIAGAPCQPYSTAGKQRGDADERHLWGDIFRIIEECQPAMVFFENVPAILQWFRPIGEELCRLGFHFEAGIFSAEECGAPQKRERLFVLAHSGCARERWHPESDQVCGEGTPVDDRGAGGTLADTRCGQLSIEGWGQKARNGTGPTGEAVPIWPPGPGDAAGWRSILQRWPDLAPALADSDRGNGLGSEQSLQRGSESGQATAGGSSPLADTKNRKRQRIKSSGETRSESRTEGNGQELSRSGSEEETESTLCVLADGLASGLDVPRADKLRASGNGVVPIVGALAFTTLWHQLKNGNLNESET